MTSRCEGCHGVKLGLDIVVGNFILLGYIGVRRRKESRCRGPCSAFLTISTIRLLGLSVCCDFPHGCIDTYDGFFFWDHTTAWEMLLDSFPCSCIIFMVDRVLLIHFLMKCDTWKVFLFRASSNGVKSIPSQSTTWVSFQ